ncbi:hypothetical protein [Lysobacter gummosus]|uniref:hypothetical protein n=1 Tax=Lysobacter gummosus TaxID=262324 RepID=UPI0036255165
MTGPSRERREVAGFPRSRERRAKSRRGGCRRQGIFNTRSVTSLGAQLTLLLVPFSSR